MTFTALNNLTLVLRHTLMNKGNLNSGFSLVCEMYRLTETMNKVH